MIQLNFKEYGSGENYLVILHGFLGTLDNWHTLAQAWAEQGLHVFSLDARNHGKSPHTASHSIALMVEDVKDFLTQQKINSTAILGHSMGGKVAMQFALTYPDLTTRIIVADIAPRPYRSGAHDEVFKAITNVDLNRAQTRKEIEQSMAVYLGDMGTRQFIMKSLGRVDDAHYRWKFNAQVLQRDYIQILHEINSPTPYLKPVIFLKGDQSLYIQEKDHFLINKLFPKADIITIERAGHWLHADSPQQVFQKVKDFLYSTSL